MPSEPTLKPRTWQRYEQFVRLHIPPALGKQPLGMLTSQNLRTLYAEGQNAGLSPATVRQLHAVLHHALDQAMRDGLIARNVG